MRETEAAGSRIEACLGIAKGPGETPQEYVFVTPDREQKVKVGEFVYYNAEVDGQPRAVLGQVVGRSPLRLYPDAFLADPTVPPASVASLLGFESQEYELFEVAVRILGYFDSRMGSFINPRIPPRAGWPIYLAPSDMLSAVVNRKRPDERGGAMVGWLLSRPAREVPIVLSVKDFTSTHLAIIASTGAGKSYLAGVLIEEMLSPRNKACLLVVDPHGEYSTLTDLQGNKAFEEGSYRPRVKVLRPADVHVRFSSLDFDDLRYLLPNLSERMSVLLRNAYYALKNRMDKQNTGKNWTAADLVAELKRIAAEKRDEDGVDYTESVSGLEWRIQSVNHPGSVLDDSRHLDLGTLFAPGQCTVLQLDEVDRREQQVVVAVLLRRLYQARMDAVRGKSAPDSPDYLPYPAFVLLEEAHHFAPGGQETGNVVSAGILRTVLAEGRKFGVGIGLISQRPGKLDQDVLSQCMTQIVLRIVNPVDQNNIAGAVEGASRQVLDELPALSKGQAVVLGASLNAPVLIQVRERISPHGGQDLDAPSEWCAYLDEEAAKARRAAGALHATPRVPESLFRSEPDGNGAETDEWEKMVDMDDTG